MCHEDIQSNQTSQRVQLWHESGQSDSQDPQGQRQLFSQKSQQQVAVKIELLFIKK